jgi:RNA polymerase sigma factor (sigma-70 family)
LTLAVVPTENASTPAQLLQKKSVAVCSKTSLGSTRTADERAALYLEIQPLVRSLLARHRGDPELCQELPGEIYCRFHRLLDRYDSSRGVPERAYLIRCLQAGIYTWVRSRWRRRGHEVELTDRLAEYWPSAHRDLAAEIADADHLKTLVQAVRRAVLELPPRQREVLIARYYGGASYEEISRSMNIGRTTVRSLARHGIIRIRVRLKRECATLG